MYQHLRIKIFICVKIYASRRTHVYTKQYLNFYMNNFTNYMSCMLFFQFVRLQHIILISETPARLVQAVVQHQAPLIKICTKSFIGAIIKHYWCTKDLQSNKHYVSHQLLNPVGEVISNITIMILCTKIRLYYIFVIQTGDDKFLQIQLNDEYKQN